MCYLLAWLPAASSQDPQSPSWASKPSDKVPGSSSAFSVISHREDVPRDGQMRVLVQAYHHPSMAKVSSMLPCSLWLDVGTGDGEH